MSEKTVLSQLHRLSQKQYLEGWLDAPTHIHHPAYRMANPAIERPHSRKEFQELLHCLGIRPSDSVVENKVGFGVATASNGDRLLAIWEAHTEYYSYQIWHIPGDPTQPLEFGPLTYSGYAFPFSPLGFRVTALDILVTAKHEYDLQDLTTLLRGPQLYGSQVMAESISVASTFTRTSMAGNAISYGLLPPPSFVPNYLV